jgi:hypothetical protein
MDPTLSLAFAMHANRGVYALLLGSGISRSAAIPTGWEVVIDLIRKLAAMQGASCDPSPEAWFLDAHGEEPTYSGLLKKLCRTPAERQQLLRGYFEPSPAEAASGEKQPTKAHEAIAALAKTGHVRVILTTNFDRLVERSLEAVGVSPVVISTAHAVDGATPLTHASCTVVKLHGDYLDARIKNTPDELAKYDRRIDRLLDRVFDEFGLVVVGWSADWDEALGKALSRCKSRRFTTYWTARGTPSDAAKRLIAHRAADTIPILGADEFFQGLHEKVLSLASFDPPHPLSAKTAVATMKRYLADDRHRIELHDLVTGEVDRLVAATSDERMPLSIANDVEEARQRLRRYDAMATVVRDMFITGAQWGDQQPQKLWSSCLERLANRPDASGSVLLIRLRRYPALVALYASGIAAIAAGNMQLLRALLRETKVRDRRGEEGGAVATELYPQAILDSSQGSNVLTPGQQTHTPLSNHIFNQLRGPLQGVLPSDGDYAEAFDRFEYFLALVYLDLRLPTNQARTWFPVGRFGWRERWNGPPPLFTRVENERKTAGANWEAITAGLFTSVERFDVLAAIVAGAL